jgi:hypothetical protein
VKLRCRIFGHEGCDDWVPVSHTITDCRVEVRRCFQCGDIVEQRDVPALLECVGGKADGKQFQMLGKYLDIPYLYEREDGYRELRKYRYRRFTVSNHVEALVGEGDNEANAIVVYNMRKAVEAMRDFGAVS